MNQPKITNTTTNELMRGTSPVAAALPPGSAAIAMSPVHAQVKRPDPLKPEKVAILGTAPSSRLLAPFGDPSWTIWGSSPGNSAEPGIPGALPRYPDAWIEMHSNFFWPEYRQLYGEAYVNWLNTKPFPLLVPCDIPQYKEMFPRAMHFPWRELVAEFGHDFFTSTFAWMMAYAIKIGVKEMALFGVDMSSKDEYILQRPGGRFFKREAEKKGIKVSIPPESDLGQPTPLYGIYDSTPMGRKAATRRGEVTGRIAAAQQRAQQANAELTYLQGALEDVDYWMSIWGGAGINPAPTGP